MDNRIGVKTRPVHLESNAIAAKIEPTPGIAGIDKNLTIFEAGNFRP